MMRFHAFGLAGMALAISFFSSPSWALTNSQPADSSEYESFVAISADAHDPESGDATTGYCNGTLLSPSVLVTAAHCVSDAITMNSNSIHVEIGKYIYVKRPDGKIVRIGYGAYLKSDSLARYYVSAELGMKIKNDGFSVKIAPDEDLVVAVLAQPIAVPAGFQFAKMPSSSEFGELLSSPKRYSPTVISVNFMANVSTSDTKRMAALDDLSWSSQSFFRSNSSSRVEEGDSGAPLLFKMPSGWVLGGVVKGQGRNFFGDWDAYAPTGFLACDISRQLPDPAQRALLCH